MPTPDASRSGTFAIGGDMTVTRLGFGAMRVTGPGIWGPPDDPEEARRTLRRVPELGIDFIDTADSYGPYISEELIAEALPSTLLLATLGFVAALVLAVLVAGLSSLAPFGWLRDGLRQVPGLFVAVPVFWLGILLIQVFSFGLGWVPIVGADPVAGLVLPVITLAVPISAPLAQVLVRAIDRVQAQPFVTVIRAKGATPLWVLTRSVARNATVPALTIAGVLFGELVGGAVVTETVFGRTGIGRLTEQAVTNQDIPVLQGVVLLSALGFVVISFAVDLLTPLIDPRQRHSATAGVSA